MSISNKELVQGMKDIVKTTLAFTNCDGEVEKQHVLNLMESDHGFYAIIGWIIGKEGLMHRDEVLELMEAFGDQTTEDLINQHWEG